MNEHPIICDNCGAEISHLEEYLDVNDLILCDHCYMNMSRKEFIEFIGGQIKVVY